MDISYTILKEYATQLLHEGIYHSDWAVRFPSAEILADFGNVQGVPDLMQGLRHKLAIIRQRGAIALGRLHQNIFIPALQRLLEDEDIEVRGHAMEAIIACVGAIALQKIDPSIHDTNRIETIGRIFELSLSSGIPMNISTPQLQKHCILALQRIPKCLSLLAKLMEDDISYILKISVAECLLEHEDYKETGISFFKKLLEHQDAWLSFLAAKNLAKIGNSLGEQQIRRMLASGGWTEKIMALESLIKLGILGEYGDLLRPKDEMPSESRPEVARLLYHIQPKEAEIAIRWMFTHGDDSTKARIISITAEWGRDDILLDLTKQIVLVGPEHLRIAIVQAIEKLGKIELILRLYPLLNQAHPLVQFQTARVILKLLGQTAIVV